MDLNNSPQAGSDASLTLLTVRFRSPVLESDFQNSQQHQVRRFMAGFAIMGLFGAILSGYGTYLQFGASAWFFQAGLWLRLPLAILLVAAVPAFLTLSSRNWVYTWHSVLLVLGCISIALRMATPYTGEETLLSLFHVSRDGVLLLLIVSLYVFSLVPGWFITNVVIMTSALAGFLAVAHWGPTSPENLLSLTLVSLAAFAFILVTTNAARRLWRRSYLAQLHLSSTNLKLAHLAQTDELTGCANRRYLFTWGNQEFEKALRYHWPLSVIAIDIDYFKSVNDHYGHAGGDRVLEAFAALLKRNLREPDLPARIGGEEFLILLPGTDQAGALLLAERLRQETETTPVATGGDTIRVRASFGVADITHAGVTDFDSLILASDTALYEAKRMGRNQVVAASNPAYSETVFSDTMTSA